MQKDKAYSPLPSLPIWLSVRVTIFQSECPSEWLYFQLDRSSYALWSSNTSGWIHCTKYIHRLHSVTTFGVLCSVSCVLCGGWIEQATQSSGLTHCNSDSLLVGKSDSLTEWQFGSMIVWQSKGLKVQQSYCQTVILADCQTFWLADYQTNNVSNRMTWWPALFNLHTGHRTQNTGHQTS